MIIYKVTNKINGKFYIGYTSKSLEERKRTHLLGSKYASYFSLFYCAIRKHGVDNFDWEIIDEATSIKESEEKEKFWIREMNSCNPSIGYNITKGGTGGDVTSNHPNREEIIKKQGLARSGNKNYQWKEIDVNYIYECAKQGRTLKSVCLELQLNKTILRDRFKRTFGFNYTDVFEKHGHNFHKKERIEIDDLMEKVKDYIKSGFDREKTAELLKLSVAGLKLKLKKENTSYRQLKQLTLQEI